MTSKERVLKTFAHEKTDRVPVDYLGNPGVTGRLMSHFKVKDHEGLLRALDVDYRYVAADYTGPSLFPEKSGRRVNSVYGFYTKYVEHETGGYWDFCDFPLLDVEDEVIAGFPVPSADDFDYDSAEAAIREYSDKAVFVGGAGTADIINATGRVMGMEETLVRLQLEDEATLSYIRRRCEMELGVLERLLRRCGKQVDFLWMGEDLGTQYAPLISLSLYREVLLPFHRLYFDLAKAYSLPVMVHTCGSSSWVYNDFIAEGVSAVDTLQPEASDMSPRYLKDTFGDKLSFHGCISTAGPLAYGTPQDVRNVCRDTLAVMMPGGGYHFAPTHMIQDNTPTENVLAMYEAVREYGVY